MKTRFGGHLAAFSEDRRGRKAFFFEKKKQKTFVCSLAGRLGIFLQVGLIASLGRALMQLGSKRFLVLFFKKELLSFP